MKMTHLTICLEKKVSISSKFNYRLIAMFTLPVDLTYVRSTGFLFPLSKIGISYKAKKHDKISVLLLILSCLLFFVF